MAGLGNSPRKSGDKDGKGKGGKAAQNTRKGAVASCILTLRFLPSREELEGMGSPSARAEHRLGAPVRLSFRLHVVVLPALSSVHVLREL